MNEAGLLLRDEQSLIREARAGSMTALGDLYGRHADTVYRIALGVLRDAGEAEDVLQDVFVGLPHALRRFDLGRELEPWLVRVTTRTALNHHRALKRRAERERRFATDLVPRSRQQWRSGDRHLEDALQKLSEPLRTVLLLREVEGYSHQEIAEMLGITPGGSAVRLHRALKRLRQELRRSK